MAEFRLTVSMVLVLILSLSMATAVAAAPSSSSSSNPHGLTAELCGDAVCLSWAPGSDNFDLYQVKAWAGDSISSRHHGLTRSNHSNSEARLPLDLLHLEPSDIDGATAVYSFQIVAYDSSSNPMEQGYSNHVTLHLPRPFNGEPPVAHRAPSGLTAELCGDAVCFNWTPGNGDYDYEQVLIWAGNSLDGRDDAGYLAPDSPGEAQLPLHYLNLQPTSRRSATVPYSFQVAGIDLSSYDNFHKEYSNHVTMGLPLPQTEVIDPSGLRVYFCGDMVCTTWTPGEGDYHYQGVKFWKTGEPDNWSYIGGVAIIPPDATEWQFTMEQMRRPREDTGDVSYTFRVEAIIGAVMEKKYVGYSEEVVFVVPGH